MQVPGITFGYRRGDVLDSIEVPHDEFGQSTWFADVREAISGPEKPPKDPHIFVLLSSVAATVPLPPSLSVPVRV